MQSLTWSTEPSELSSSILYVVTFTDLENFFTVDLIFDLVISDFLSFLLRSDRKYVLSTKQIGEGADSKTTKISANHTYN